MFFSQVRLWDVQAGTCLLTFTEPENFVRCVAFHGQVLVFFCVCFLRFPPTENCVWRLWRWGSPVGLEVKRWKVWGGGQPSQVGMSQGIKWLWILNSFKHSNISHCVWLHRRIHYTLCYSRATLFAYSFLRPELSQDQGNDYFRQLQIFIKQHMIWPNSKIKVSNVCHFQRDEFCTSELSRDKTLMVSDFWLKTVDSLGPKESESGRLRHSRFLNRDIMSL